MSLVLDTHAALWYLENSEQLSTRARTALESAIREGKRVWVSAISVVEVTYLVERNRVPPIALTRLRAALSDPLIALDLAPIDAAVADAVENIPRSVVPDMPDRIVAATALHLGFPLVTRDRRIQSASIPTIW
jgi:PIN domain nuclease of toxin-antitoxin system